MAITLVGTASGSNINGGDVTITLPSLQEGDVVYAAGGIPDSSADAGVSTSGYTELVDFNSPGSPDWQMSVSRKVMGATPDTQVVCKGSGGAADATAYVAICLRGVDTATPEDAATTTVIGNSGAPNSPSITTVTDGAWVISFVGAEVTDSSVTAPSGYSNQVDNTGNDNNDATAGGATKEIATAGTEDPPAWTDWLSGRWGAATVAVRPAPAGVTITPSVQSVAAGIVTAVVKAGVSLALAAQVASAGVPSPVIKTGAKISPNVRSASVSLQAPTVLADDTVTPPVQCLTSSIPPYTIGVGVTVNPPAQGVSASVPTPAIEFAYLINPLSLSVSVPDPKVVVPMTLKEARSGPRAEPVWLVEVMLGNSGPSLYFSDRNITMSGQRYEDYIAGVAGLSDGIAPASPPSASITFRNEKFQSYGHLIEAGETYPFEGAAVTVKECYLDERGMPSTAATVFEGFLDAPQSASLADFSCRLLPSVGVKDRQWKQPLIDLDAWPNALEDVGEVEPVIYGGDIMAPALRVDWGARTTLLSQISASATGLELSDASRLPSAGSIWIDSEKISYTGKSGNTLTGLTRGTGGTTATAHRAGADAVEAKAQYDSLLASHELYSVGDIYAEVEGKLWRVVSGVSAVLSGGKHLLRATDQIRIMAVEDAISVSDDIDMSVDGSTKNVYPDGLEPDPGPGTHDVSNSSYAYDGNDNTACTLNPNKNTTGRLQLGFPETNHGTINTQYIHAKLLGEIVIGGGWAPTQVDSATSGWFRFSKSGGNWDDYVAFSNQDTGESPLVYEVYKEVEYSSSATKSGSAFRSGDIVATHIVERFHAVVSGMKDPDGNYGGTGSLIERPDYVIKHFLVERMGFSLADMDADSFNSAGSSYSSAGYNFAFRIDERVKPSELLLSMSRECRSALRHLKGMWKLDYLPDAAPEATRTISSGELAGEFSRFTFSRTPLKELSNNLTARLRRNYCRLTGESAWDATVSASDATSQAKYGSLPEGVDFALIRDSSMASHVLSFMLTAAKEPRLTVTFPVFYEHFDMEPGDTIEIENPLYGGRKFLIDNIRRTDKFRAEIRATQWWG